MQAKDVAEVMKLQTEFLRSQFGVATGQFKQMAGMRWSRFLRQAVKVDLLTKRMIHHEDTQTVYG
jgi:hypothetical protein